MARKNNNNIKKPAVGVTLRTSASVRITDPGRELEKLNEVSRAPALQMSVNAVKQRGPRRRLIGDGFSKL